MAYLLENVPCSNGDTSCLGSRALAFKTKVCCTMAEICVLSELCANVL